MNKRAWRCRGFSLTELMVGMAIGLLAIAAALRAYATTRAAIQAENALADVQERAAFALTLLEEDLRLAGFWGLHARPQVLTVQPGIRVHCGGSDVTNWALQLAVSVAAASTTPCPPFNAATAGSDILEVRHAGARPTGLRSGTVQLQTTHTQGHVMNDGSWHASLPNSRVHDVAVHAWFISPQSSEPGIPALRRYTLSSNGLMRNEEIMPGIERLTLSLGVDSDSDGRVDAFVRNPNPTTDKLLAVRIGLSVRTPLHDGWLLRQGNADSHARLITERTILLPNAALHP